MKELPIFNGNSRGKSLIFWVFQVLDTIIQISTIGTIHQLTDCADETEAKTRGQSNEPAAPPHSAGLPQAVWTKIKGTVRIDMRNHKRHELFN